ncbi:MAG: hypothetical protein ABI324_04185 [Ktedonobacteraceae bacterium]
MDITPLISDGYTGPIKRLTCSIPALQEEGIAVRVPPETTLVNLSRKAE